MKYQKIVLSLFILLYGFVTVNDLRPPGKIGPYLDGVFPSKVPGLQGAWDIVNPLPNISIKSPIRIISFGSTGDVLVLNKAGEVHRLSTTNKSSQIVLDISAQTFKLGDCGSVGIAIHPNFDSENPSDYNKVFIYYKTKPNPEDWSEMGFNRLSSFKWDTGTQRFDVATEEILIQQFDHGPWHDSGAMFFGDDGMLYLSIGDEGPDSYQELSTQRLDGGFFSGILRIDVDNDPVNSHPIIRQPQSNGAAPSGWGNTFSQGYSIPNDNPWLSETGDHLEEFYAIGLRSPFAMHYDKNRKKIWVADVGSDKAEEINLIEKGDNGQWPYKEGYIESEIHSKPDNLIGNEKEVYFEVERGLSSCIIGGGVYNGSKFPFLNEKYLFADFNLGKLMSLTNNGVNQEPILDVLISDISGINSEVPEKGGITGVHILDDGNIWITVMGEDYSKPGKIFQLEQKDEVEEPPYKLSDLGVFEDLQSLTPRDGIIPYDVNAPLYSDNALKQRWIAIPNDGVIDSENEKIDFSENGAWSFAEGTVFIKHFSLQLNEGALDSIVPLETRFFIIGEDNERYGVTYKWNEEGTEAFLLGGGASKELDIYEDDDFAYTQTWDFPSRDQCMTCHNAAAGHVLGVKTHQLNKTFDYPHLGTSMNQLTYFNELGIFNNEINEAESYIKSAPIDDETQSLEWRIRSYLDANCASCHKLGGVKDVFLDFTLSQSKSLVEYYDVESASHASSQNSVIIKPGDHAASELWIRDASEAQNKMPPIGRNFVDQIYVDSLAKWIDNIDVNTIENDHKFLMFPNPTDSWLIIKLDDTWELPLDININSTTGRLIYQSSTDKFYNYIDLGLYPRGTYFVSIISGDRRQAKKIILN